MHFFIMSIFLRYEEVCLETVRIMLLSCINAIGADYVSQQVVHDVARLCMAFSVVASMRSAIEAMSS